MAIVGNRKLHFLPRQVEWKELKNIKQNLEQNVLPAVLRNHLRTESPPFGFSPLLCHASVCFLEEDDLREGCQPLKSSCVYVDGRCAFV